MSSNHYDLFPKPRLNDLDELTEYHGEYVGMRDFSMVHDGLVRVDHIPAAIHAAREDLSYAYRDFEGMVVMPEDPDSGSPSKVLKQIGNSPNFVGVQLSGNSASDYMSITGSEELYGRRSRLDVGTTEPFRTIAIATVDFEHGLSELGLHGEDDRIIRMLRASDEALRTMAAAQRTRKIGGWFGR